MMVDGGGYAAVRPVPPSCRRFSKSTHRRSGMLSPIVTKEMQLFPGSRLAPTNKGNLKNVRARALSLNEVASQSGKSHISVTGGRSVTVGAQGRKIPKTSQSVGNLPLAASSNSPPKQAAVRKATLDPIVEGVELGSEKKRGSSSVTTSDPPPAPPPAKGTKKKEGVLSWLTSKFSRKSSREEDSPSTSSKENTEKDNAKKEDGKRGGSSSRSGSALSSSSATSSSSRTVEKGRAGSSKKSKTSS